MFRKVQKLKKILATFLVSTMTASLFIMASEYTTVYANQLAPILNMDYKAYVASGDVDYTGIITKSQNGLPIGTGKMGSLVWNNNDHSLNFQINRVDVYGYNSAGTGSLNGNNDYGYGCGFVNVDLGGNPLTSSTKQHLSLYDGKLAIQGNGVSADIISDVNSDVFALKINDTRTSPAPVSIDLVMLQNPDVTIGTHVATTRTSNNGQQIRLKQTFTQPAATGYKQFDHYCSSAVVIDVDGRTGSVSYPDSKTVRLSLPATTGTAYVYIGSHASMNKSDDVVAMATDEVNASKNNGFDSIYSNNQTWWKNFWSKSYIYLPSDATTLDYQKKWIYYLYLSAISMRGDYPAKFAGNIWNTGGLDKMWGTEYWGYNQECLHYSFDAANHGELQQPFFTMDMKNYDNYATAAQQQWGSQGIFINETEYFNGPELLPTDIANDLKNFMINGASPSTELSNFARQRNSMHSRWILSPTYWTTFTTINASERAEHFWNHYLYTLDTNFLSEQAYPMLKGAAEFYRNFPNLKLESDGKYHIYRTNLHEHIMGGKDIIDDLVFIKGVMQSAKKASEILDVDSNLRPLWQNIVDNLTPYPVSGQSDTIGSITHSLGYKTWEQGKNPAAQVRLDACANEPQSPRLRMLENYNVLTLETKDQGLDGGDWDIANNSFEANVGYNLNMKSGNYGYAGGRYLLDSAALGRTEFNTVLRNINKEINSAVAGCANRLGFVTSDFTEFEGYGIMSAGLQNGLMQSISSKPGEDPVIRVFPAWDVNKTAYFKLLAKGGFLVSSSANEGQISFIEIDSQLGGTCRIRNPWPGNKVTLYRNGVKAEELTGSLLSFSTDVDENIKIVKQNVSIDSYKDNIPAQSQIGVKYEAENAVLSGGAGVNTDHVDYSGTGFVDGYFNKGATTTFNVSAPKQGNCKVYMRYSAGRGGTETVSIYVNDLKVKQTNLQTTGSWDIWADKVEILPLNAGNNTITFKCDEGDSGWINIDYIALPATPTIMYGDLNNDKTIDAIDFALLKQVLMGMEPANVDMSAADLNADGVVDAIDLALLKKHLLGAFEL